MRNVCTSLTFLCLLAMAADAEKPTVPIRQSIEQANLVIVGRVVGLIDQKPIARTRKTREAHFVDVLETLMGTDAKGERLRVRPGGLLWEDGKQYILFLQRRGMGDWATAVTQMRTEATKANLAAVKAQILLAGGAVTPKPVLFMRHTGGWGGGIMAEWVVLGDRSFVWRKRVWTGKREDQIFNRRSGKMDAKTLAALIGKIAAAGKGPMAEDAGHVAFHWTGKDRKRQSKAYSMPSEPPCKGLLAEIERLALAHGVAPPELLSDEEVKKRGETAVEKITRGAFLSPLASSNVHLGGVREIGNPFQKHAFFCVLLPSPEPRIMGPPNPRRFLCVSRVDGKAIYPFTADRLADVLRAEDTATWSDAKWLQAACLYVHLTTVANQDGWRVTLSGKDYLAITFNMPRRGPAAAKRREAAEAIRPPAVIRTDDGGVTVRLTAWHLIGGFLREWTIRFKPTVKAESKLLCRFGGGGYD